MDNGKNVKAKPSYNSQYIVFKKCLLTSLSPLFLNCFFFFCSTSFPSSFWISTLILSHGHTCRHTHTQPKTWEKELSVGRDGISLCVGRDGILLFVVVTGAHPLGHRLAGITGFTQFLNGVNRVLRTVLHYSPCVQWTAWWHSLHTQEDTHSIK